MDATLKVQPGELRATIHVKRKATGKTETFEIVGHSDAEKLKEILAARRHHGSAGSLVGQGSNLKIKES